MFPGREANRALLFWNPVDRFGSVKGRSVVIGSPPKGWREVNSLVLDIF